MKWVDQQVGFFRNRGSRHPECEGLTSLYPPVADPLAGRRLRHLLPPARQRPRIYLLDCSVVRELDGEGHEICRCVLCLDVDQVFECGEREGGGGVEDRVTRAVPSPSVEQRPLSVERSELAPANAIDQHR
jgi:hypothetical protein